jgi:hypothetical protein
MQQARLGLLADIAKDLSLSRAPLERGPEFGLLPRPLERQPAPHPTAEALIREAVRGQIGLVSVRIPALPHPIWLRAGTGDADACIAALSPETGLKIPYGARRILDLGIGAGYQTVALAHRFPEADIIAAEADPALHTLALLNTLPYRNIKFRAQVVDMGGGQYAFAGRFAPGGAPSLIPQAEAGLAAIALPKLLDEVGWKIFDTAIITLDPATLPILRHPWPKTLRMLAIHNGGQKFGPAAAEALGAQAQTARPAGHYMIIMRREVEDAWPAPRPVPLYDPLGPPARMAYTRPDSLPARYFSIFPHGFRLHPNSQKQPATLSLSYTCQSHAALRVRLRVSHKESNPVHFTISVLNPAGGEPIGHAEVVLGGGRETPVEVALLPFFGPCRVVFKTAMVDEALSHHAWAEFLDPVFV